MKKKIDLLEEHSDYSREILEKTPSWIVTWGNSIFFIFIAVLFFISWMIKYPDIISTQVEVTSQHPPVYLVSRTNGKVNELNVLDGGEVKKDSWLAIIENPAKTADIRKIDSLLNHYSDIKTIPTPLNLKLGEVQSYYNEFIKALNQFKYFNTFNPQLVGISSNQDRINKVNNVQGEFNNQKEIARKEYEVKKKEYSRNRDLFEQGVISKNEFEKSQIELLQTENKYKSYNSNISNLESDKSIIKKENVDLSLQKENQKIELSTNLENSAQELKAQILTWKNKYLIEAPTDGKINFFDIWQKDQYVKNEQTLFSIIPNNNDTGKYFARAKMPMERAGKVKVGQKVNIKLLNYPFEEYGVLEGKVKKVTNVTNENVYYVIIELNKGLITSYNKKITPNNLMGQAEIITDDIRLLQRFIYTLVRNFKER
ncbi:HlyD family efflux transporter periplasmic adaptor subunit [Chryseobacterium carnipullorum]|uniref:HlyD family efflux transporter periplasmic adaptor subunit n=1 Tax=Chryseobacterium carnipullorum TaxID=1124835 RepID=A0A3G6LV21_CHRCU|nr:HlyD family efflux transporter periplasmic adaptor subunit [Chryseobacterium carnipullorum]AZA47100.1 HlyD family efflux transporter periplasmic adaptor subunit [Chryseobacterium carnipullorum]AZA66451.1 HlyD family efflux transporter periplasmic adaptor subunit [Chryseobacterium carnipullorum]